MFIADAHCDTLYAIAIEKKKLSECAVTPVTLSAGGVGLQTFALFAGPEGPSGTPYANALAMLDAVEKLEYVFTVDFGFVAVFCVLMLLSYIFTYGQALQRESDETL